MIRAGKLNRRVTLWRMPPDTLTPTQLAQTWVSWRAKPDEATLDIQTAPAPAGLRNPVPLELRLRHRANFQVGDYITWDGRLAHVYSLRDPNGRNSELVASCHELIGHPATYQETPQGSPIATRAFLRFDAPYVGVEARAVDYRAHLELPIFEVRRPPRGATVAVGAVTWTIQTLIGDDNVVRAVWATR